MIKSLHLPVFKLINQAAKNIDTECFVIGGFVRDLFLDRESKDLDIVCTGSGIELAQEVSKLLNLKTEVVVFKNFGTAMISYQGWEIEFVGARKESYQHNSRKPIVENGTLEDDQNRRDFTINAMAISLNDGTFGDLIDPFDGKNDLNRKILRTPLAPAITFSDDPLRMLRAIRFASQLDFEIDPESLAAIKQEAQRIEIVSQERITDELNKIILSDHPTKGFTLLLETGLLGYFFPEMVDLHGVEVRNGLSHKDNFFHTLQVLENVKMHSKDLWLYWAAILHDIAKPPTKRFDEKHGWTFHGHEDRGARMVPGIFKRLKLPLDHKMKFVQKLVKLHLRPIALVKETVTDSAVRRLLYEAGEDIDSLMELCSADITTKNEKRHKKYLKNFKLVQEKMLEVEEKDKLRNWQPPISGDEIMQLFSIGPSKEVGLLKNKIREAILDGELNNEKETVLEYLVVEGKKLGLRPLRLKL